MRGIPFFHNNSPAQEAANAYEKAADLLKEAKEAEDCNLSEAAKLYRKAFDRQKELAEMFELGTGPTETWKEAADAYEKAADLLKEAAGVADEDQPQVAELYRKAALKWEEIADALGVYRK